MDMLMVVFHFCMLNWWVYYKIENGAFILPGEGC